MFAVCEPNATGSLGALEQTELDGKVAFIAFDPNAGLDPRPVHQEGAGNRAAGSR